MTDHPEWNRTEPLRSGETSEKKPLGSGEIEPSNEPPNETGKPATDEPVAVNESDAPAEFQPPFRIFFGAGRGEHPRLRKGLLMAGLAAFVAWGVALTVVWISLRGNRTPPPTESVARLLERLEQEADLLRKEESAGLLYRLPGDIISPPRNPRSDFAAADLAFLREYESGELPSDSVPTPGDTTSGAADSAELPGLPGLPGLPDSGTGSVDENHSEGSDFPNPANESGDENTLESGLPSDAGRGPVSPDAERLIREILRHRLEGNRELTRLLSRYPDSPDAVWTAAEYFRLFSRPQDAAYTGQILLGMIPETESSNPAKFDEPTAAVAMSPGVNGADGATGEAGGAGTLTDVGPAAESFDPSSPSSPSSQLEQLRCQAWALLGEASLEMNQPDAAMDYFTRVHRTPWATGQSRLRLATAQYRNGDFAAAIRTLQPLLVAHPYDTAVLTLLGKSLLRSANPIAADAAFRQVTERTPDRPESAEAWLGLASCAAQRHDVATVALALAGYRKVSSDGVGGGGKYGNADAENGDGGNGAGDGVGSGDMAGNRNGNDPTDGGPGAVSAAECRAELERARGSLASLLVMIAECSARDDLLQTDRLLRRAIVVDDRCESAYLLMSVLFERQGLTGEALRTLETGVQASSSARLACELAALSGRHGRRDDAHRWLRRAVELDPRAPEYHAVLATFCLENAATDRQAAGQAFVQAMVAVDLEPTSKHYLLLATAAMATGDPAAARDAATRAVALDPGNAETRRFLESMVGPLPPPPAPTQPAPATEFL